MHLSWRTEPAPPSRQRLSLAAANATREPRPLKHKTEGDAIGSGRRPTQLATAQSWESISQTCSGLSGLVVRG